MIVEAHPAFLAGAYESGACASGTLVGGQLEVAIGLETAHPEVLARLNKRMTLDAFKRPPTSWPARHRAARVHPAQPAVHAGMARRSSGRAARSTSPRSAAPPSCVGDPDARRQRRDGGCRRLVPPPRLDGLESSIEYRARSRWHARVRRSLGRRAVVHCDCSPARAARLADHEPGAAELPRSSCSRLLG